MNYKPNVIQWKVGDLVLHDCDAKEGRMLMRVVGFTRNGLVRTAYVDSELQRQWGWPPRSRLINRMVVLHDPARFGVVCAALAGTKGGEEK